MKTIDFRGPHGWLSIQATIVEGSNNPLPGLQYMEFQAGGFGFFGSGSCFIEESQLRAFCQAIYSMPDDLLATAQINSSNGEGLTLNIGAAHSSEYVAIEGSMLVTRQLTLPNPDAHGYKWGMQFGFWLERKQIYRVRKVEWVKHYALANKTINPDA